MRLTALRASTGRARRSRRACARRSSSISTLSVIIHIVIRSFADVATEHLFNGVDSRHARAACPSELWPAVRRKLTQINRVRDLRELAIPPGNRLERLAGDRRGQHSIRVNEQYRICFRWEDGYADEVEVTDYH
ncbi:MAG: type II toxin-antitoxin system RelE/ParE family toxin [Gemmatimonadaceae bacterium]